MSEPTPIPLYQAISRALGARDNCKNGRNVEWFGRHTDRLEQLAKALPSGAGIDAGSQLDLDGSTPDKIRITTRYHHMSDHGYYEGWTEHTVIVTPSLANRYDLRITGCNRRDIKTYLYDTFAQALEADSGLIHVGD